MRTAVLIFVMMIYTAGIMVALISLGIFKG